MSFEQAPGHKAGRTPQAIKVMPFPTAERQLLLKVPGIGAAVIARLESVGVHSLSELAATGPNAVVRRICHELGNRAWENRRRALEAALQLTGTERS